MNDFPRRFGQYLLLKPLARGGMGALYLALSGPEESAKLCVIKTVLPHLADKEYLQRFRDEAKVVVRLSHGNLVPVFDSGQVAGEIYLAMDFVEGKDLRATWNRCAKKGIAFPIDVAAHIVKELTRGLHYAHGFGDIKLVHRDVSPPNVLLSYSGEVRLTDFGLAASTLKLEKTAPGIIYGKVSYMSPEQARGEPLDGRTDLYAAGIILWELLTGRQLFPSGKAPGAAKDIQTSEELLRRVRNPEALAPSRRASRVPPELDRIALRALAPELPDRYATCEEMRQDLATFLAQTSPGTDSVRVASFLSDLYAPDIDFERGEREDLIHSARQWFSSGVLPRATMAGTAASVPTLAAGRPGKGDKPVRSDDPTAPGADGEGGGRNENHTLVAGPVRHDHALDKRLGTDHVPTGQSQEIASDGERLSAAVLGTVVGGRYHIRRLCGEGGMGRVYEAEHIEIGKRVALKILHPAYSQTPDLVERLRREARAASKISHPNVVDVTDSGTTPEGAFFFVMEYLEGVELGELIFRQQRLEVRRALHIGEQVCRALGAAHDVNVIHRDLKPENVLILARDDDRDFVKVLDFGIAKSGELDDEKDSQGHLPRRLTHPGMTMGTPEYMAPEQAAGRPADPRSDIYAVGGLLYEMLSGNPPYEGENFMEILHKKANSLPAPLSGIRDDVPQALEALITRTLAKDPGARPQSMEELGRELQNLAATYYPSLGRLPVASGDGVAQPSSRKPSSGGWAFLDASASAASGLFGRMRALERKKLAIAGGGLLALMVAFVVVNSAANKGAVLAPSPPAASSVPAPAPAPPALAAVAPPSGPAGATEPEEAEVEAESPGAEREGGDRRGRTSRGSSSSSSLPPPDGKKLLAEGERLLRAERFVEARGVFDKAARSRRDRGAALVGLAEISFQEKNYAQAVRSAMRAVDHGGGVRARVLLGDAHFRLNHFKEAARAYEGALKLDPANTSAKSGLALANKRM